MFEIEQIKKVRVLCIGDIMLDRYLYGEVSRISPEGPVPVARIKRSDNVAGGVANVAGNITALGAQATVCGVIGEDASGRDLELSLAQDKNIDTRLLTVTDRPTTEKIRYMAQGQQLLRADHEDAKPLNVSQEQQLMQILDKAINDYDALVLSDYAKGVLTPNILSHAIHLANCNNIPVIVDPKYSDFSRYAGATVITPNGKEIREATSIDPTDDQKAQTAGQKALQAGKVGAVLVTRAEQGMSLIRQDQPAVHIRATAHEVYDVVGAGDTVVATLAVCLGAGLSLEEAARLANMAAGIVVQKSGTATVSMFELLEAIKQQDQAHDPQNSIKNKVVPLSELKLLRTQWAKQGLKVGFTNGCFDLLHVGHVSLLTFARAQCDKLIVGLNSDASIKRLKGPERPINPQTDRGYVLAALQSIDAVVIFEEDTPKNLIEALTPDVLVKGADYTIDQIVGADHVLAHGGEVKTFELIPGRSSTQMIEKAKQASQSNNC